MTWEPARLGPSVPIIWGCGHVTLYQFNIYDGRAVRLMRVRARGLNCAACNRKKHDGPQEEQWTTSSKP